MRLLKSVPILMSGGIRYLLRDEFTTALVGGAVNGTLAEPGGSGTVAQLTRLVTDTESKLSVANGALTLAGGKATPAFGNPGLWHGGFAREAGRMAIYRVTFPNATRFCEFGWFTGQINSPQLFVYCDNAGNIGQDAVAVVGEYTATTYLIAFVLRATGGLMFFKGGAFSKWELLGNYIVSASTPLYPGVSNYNSLNVVDSVRVPLELWLPVPLVSDGFSVASSDGLGHAETSGIGSGGAGFAWTDTAGTWGVAGGVAACSALAGGLGLRTLTPDTANIVISCDLTRAGGNVGIVVRYADADNYVLACHDGTNAKVIQRLAGVETTPISAAAAYGAGRKILVNLSGQTIRLYYNNAVIGTKQTLDASLSGAVCGLYTTHTGNSFDNFLVRARGNEGQYSYLDKFANP